MSDASFPLLPGPDLIAALISQSGPVRRFGLSEADSEELLLALTDGVDQALYRPGGLLNRQSLEPFFTNPLPDAPLDAAVENQVGSRSALPGEAAQVASKQEQKDAQRVGNKTSVQAGIEAPRQKSRRKKRRDSEHQRIEADAANERQPGKGNKHGIAAEQTIQQKVGVLQEAKKRAASKTRTRRAAAVTSIADKQKKLDIKSPEYEKTHKFSDRAADKKDRKVDAAGSSERTISPRQASKILNKKWNNKAWKSPLGSKGKSAWIALSDAKKQAPIGQGEMLLRVDDKKLEQKTAQIAATKKGAGKHKKSLDSVLADKPWAEKKLEQKTAQILARKKDVGKRKKNLDGALADKPWRDKKPKAADKKLPPHKAETGFDKKPASADAFTPPAGGNKERLVGLRGLAARAAANEDIAASTDFKEQGVGTDRASSSARAQVPTASAAPDSAPAPPGGTSRRLSVSELAELIAQEAKRAGIDLEQFQP